MRAKPSMASLTPHELIWVLLDQNLEQDVLHDVLLDPLAELDINEPGVVPRVVLHVLQVEPKDRENVGVRSAIDDLQVVDLGQQVLLVVVYVIIPPTKLHELRWCELCR